MHSLIFFGMVRGTSQTVDWSIYVFHLPGGVAEVSLKYRDEGRDAWEVSPKVEHTPTPIIFGGVVFEYKEQNAKQAWN